MVDSLNLNQSCALERMKSQRGRSREIVVKEKIFIMMGKDQSDHYVRFIGLHAKTRDFKDSVFKYRFI